MSVATSSLATPTRSKALMVRLAPYLVEALCELTRALKEKTHSQTEIGGLLFGKSQDGLLTVEALKTFKDSSGPRSDLARRERMEKAFTAAMTLANEDSEFAQFNLLGWFSLRGGGGLINSDIEFHNQHFKNNEGIALIVWREGDTQLTTELYAPVENAKLTTEDYRWSSVRLSTELRHVSQPLDLIMRVRMNDDLYLRTYGMPDGGERKEEWKRIAENAKRTILSLLPGRGHSEVVVPEDLPSAPPSGTAKRSFETSTLFRRPDTEPSTAAFAPAAPAKPVSAPPPSPAVKPAEAAAASAASYDVNRAPRPKVTPEISGLPMVLPKHKPGNGTPWFSMALVFVLCSGLTFGFMALKSAGGGEGKLSQVMKVLFPGTDLELRAASHGDSLWLTWNRKNSVVAASTGAVLAVSDGPRHFERKLDAGQVADGEVKYTPVSGDVTFQLRVYGTDQSVALGSLRVVDATSPAATDAKQPLDLTNPTSSESSAANNPALAPPPSSDPVTQGPPVHPTGNRSSEQHAAANNKATIPAVVFNPPSLPISNSTAADSATKPTVETPKSGQVIKPQTQPAMQEPVQSAQQQPTPVVPATPKPAMPRPASTSTANSNNSAPPTSNTAINGWDANVPENKPVAPVRQQQQQPEAPPDSKTIDFIGPKVLLQVMPDTRNLTPGLITEVTRVEVEVRVDISGHVKSARLMSPNVKGQLGSAATAAAKQWTFQPATMRGQYVESDHTIVFEFRPEGQ